MREEELTNFKEGSILVTLNWHLYKVPVYKVGLKGGAWAYFLITFVGRDLLTKEPTKVYQQASSI